MRTKASIKKIPFEMIAIKKFQQLIINEEYYDAHESLEEVWFPIRKTKSDFCLVLKGFINAAVSLELLKRGKNVQSQKIYLIYLKYVTVQRIQNTQFSKEFEELKLFLDTIYKKKNFKI